jgi:hypothetical protein
VETKNGLTQIYNVFYTTKGGFTYSVRIKATSNQKAESILAQQLRMCESFDRIIFSTIVL